MNVFEFALKMEADGKMFYEKLAAETPVPDLKSIFNLLASSEEEHHRAIEAMKNNAASLNVESKILEKVKNVFESLMTQKNIIEKLKKDHEGCLRAIRLAMACTKLYERMAEQEANPTAANILRMLAKEERKHLEIMENIYDFVEAPREYLVWGECSKLAEL